MNLLSTNALLTAIDGGRRRPTMALRDMLFPTPFQSDEENIVLDDIADDLEIAAYVSPDVETPDSALPQQTAESFKPGYVKERNRIKPAHGLVRAPGESPVGTGSLSADQRMNMVIERQLIRQDDRISRLEEYQASQVVQSGRVLVEGDNIKKYIVDFNRDPSLNDALVGAARWGNDGVDIIRYLETRAEAVGDVSGASADMVILGPDSLAEMRKDEDIRLGLDNTRQAGGSFQFGPTPAAGDGKHLVYVGTYGGFEYYKYRQKFMINGALVDMFPTRGCLVVDPIVFNGYMCHGAVLDKAAGLAPLPRFPKMFDKEDPAGTYIMTQSAPLTIPGNINASSFSLV